MPTLDAFKGMLPYASELLGIYQPLLGWKSRLTRKRYDRARHDLYLRLADRVLAKARSPVKVTSAMRDLDLATAVGRGVFEVQNLVPVLLEDAPESHVDQTIDSAVARLVRQEVGAVPPEDWGRLVTPERMTDHLREVQATLTADGALERNPELRDYVRAWRAAVGPSVDAGRALQAFFERETKIAGYLVFLAQHQERTLTELFFRPSRTSVAAIAAFEDPLLNFGDHNYTAVLSPIGLVHLYRQYFFEFDSFLGPPVGHVWLSPGGTVELIEVNTRKVFTEQAFETMTETTFRSEEQNTTQDDLADAVKDENRNDIKFGFTNTAAYTVPVFQDTATASFSIDNAKSNSRETTHKQMRLQSEKLSSEIKRNFKTTFRTSTEVTDTTSKRYVIQNTTKKLANYELRRKMRKVGVQVQDIGVQLCWHTFVDDPGRELGISKLVHIGEPPSLADLVQPDQPEIPIPQSQDINLSIPFVGKDTDDTSIAYTHGVESDIGYFDAVEYIEANFPFDASFKLPGFTLVRVDPDPLGNDAKLSVHDLVSAEGSSTGSFLVHLDYVHWHDQSSINIKCTLQWVPSTATTAAVTAQYNAKMGEYNVEKARRYKEAFYKSARDRIKLASKIKARPTDDLREEERTVVYRKLISQLMSVGTHESKHVTSELVRSIFDVDKMLYFVAPEWWMPRLHRSAQHLGQMPAEASPPAGPSVGSTTGGGGMVAAAQKLAALAAAAAAAGLAKGGTPITATNIVDWGGAKELLRDSYYITEENSDPAKFGASLGWLLQLDGDNLRNTMLNSPWVKAVIPIRIGKEREAINWLQQAHVEGSDGLDASYVAAEGDPDELHSSPGHAVTIRDALDHLIERIHEYSRSTRTPIIANPADPEDASNHFAGSLPTEAVFEHGFYPLKGGVKFDQDGTEQAVFSQWMEILPTDQVVALQVDYDPKTLQIKVVGPGADDDEDDDDFD